MEYYILNGEIQALGEGEALPKGAIVVTGHPLHDDNGNPIAGVVINMKTGLAALDREMQLDMETDHEAKRAAHAEKAAQAAFVASGYELTAGLLWREAEATGVPIAELAQSVLAAAAPAHEIEVARRVAKTGG